MPCATAAYDNLRQTISLSSLTPQQGAAWEALSVLLLSASQNKDIMQEMDLDEAHEYWGLAIEAQQYDIAWLLLRVLLHHHHDDKAFELVRKCEHVTAWFLFLQHTEWAAGRLREALWDTVFEDGLPQPLRAELAVITPQKDVFNELIHAAIDSPLAAVAQRELQRIQQVKDFATSKRLLFSGNLNEVT